MYYINVSIYVYMYMHTRESSWQLCPRTGSFSAGAGLAWLLPRGLAALKSLWLVAQRLRAVT